MKRSVPQPWIDVSVPIHSGMVHWPGDPAVVVDRVKDVKQGDIATLSMISLGSHSGTHIDAPLHFMPDGRSIDEMPLEVAIGLARVVQISDPESIKPKELRQNRLRRGERILFKTRNSSQLWQTDAFIEDFVFISDEGAQFLAGVGLRLVGIDSLSVGGFGRDSVETHLALLRAGCWIIEGLNLSQVPPGEYELICLPLRIQKGDGAPARVVLRSVATQ